MVILKKIKEKISDNNKHFLKYFVITIIQMILAIGLNSLIVQKFNLVSETDLYVLAMVLIGFIYKPISDGSILIFILPSYLNHEKSKSFLLKKANLFFLIGILISLIIYAFLDRLIPYLFSSLSNIEIIKVTYFCKILLLALPIEFFIGTASIYYYKQYDFNFAGKLGILNKSITILSILYFQNKFGIEIVVYCVLLNRIINFSIIFINTKFFYQHKKNILEIRKKIIDRSSYSLIKSVIETSGLIIFTIAIYRQINLLGAGFLSFYFFSKQIFTGFEAFFLRPMMVISHALSSERIEDKEISLKIFSQFVSKSFVFFSIVLIFIYFLIEEFILIAWNIKSFSNEISLSLIFIFMYIEIFIFSKANMVYRFNLSHNRSFSPVFIKFLLILIFVLILNLSSKNGFLSSDLLSIVLYTISFNLLWLIYNIYNLSNLNFKIFDKKVFNFTLKILSFIGLQILFLSFIFELISFNNLYLNFVFKFLSIVLIQLFFFYSKYFKDLMYGITN